MNERWRAARLSLQLSAPCVAGCVFRRRIRCAQSPDDATSIISRARNADDAAEEFIPFFRGAYCYFIDINNDRRFPATYGVHRGGACVTLRDAAAEVSKLVRTPARDAVPAGANGK